MVTRVRHSVRRMMIAGVLGAVWLAFLLSGPPSRGVTARVVAESLPSQSDPVAQEGARLVQTRCVICHSVDLVTQQRLTRAQWNAAVVKMVHWGAPLSASEQQVLVEYLASRYPPDAPDEKTE